MLSADQPLTGLDVLVVEDDPDSLDVLRQSLEFFGARVSAASTVEEARRRIQAAPPRILITDIDLGRETGADLLRWLRAQPHARTNQLPAIAITGHREYFEDREGAGFADWLLKPLRAEALCAAVLRAVSVPDRHLDRRRA
jgi:CheY-like chemotaxis protein